MTQLEFIKKEIKLHKQLIHPNIIRLYDYFKVNRKISLLMELAEMGNLYNLLQTQGKLPENVAAKYFCDICHGVAYLHQKNVIHRDIKVFPWLNLAGELIDSFS